MPRTKFLPLFCSGVDWKAGITFRRLMKFSRYVSHKEKYRPRSAAMDFVGVSRQQNESGVLRGGSFFRGFFLTEVVGLTVVCTPSRGQRNKSKKYLKPLSNKDHAFPTVSERQGCAGDVLCCSNEYNCESFSPVQHGS